MFPFSRSISESDLVDLQGKVAIVTGGNTGVGYGTVQFLARKGAKVYIAARSETKALAAIQRLQAEDIGKGSLQWLNIDLSDPRLAKKAAEDFISKEDRLDILVNNAAKGAGPFSLDKDGLLDIMVTNYISHYVFTRTLLPVLQRTAEEPSSDVRIINVTSQVHSQVHPTSFKGKECINQNYGEGFMRYMDTYGHSKLANVLHIAQLQRFFNASNPSLFDAHRRITCMAVHPGAVSTEGSFAVLDTAGFLGGILKLLFGLFGGAWRDGGMNVAWAAAGKEIASSREFYAGKYVVPIAKVVPPSPEAQDETLAKELMETTEEILKELGL